jgi:hypothetical protein
MTRYEELAVDLAEVFGEIAQPVEWQGGTYQAVISDPVVNLDLQTGGFLPQGEFQVKLRRSSLSVMPAPGQILRIQGVPYQISGLTDRPTSPLIIFHVSRS